MQLYAQKLLNKRTKHFLNQPNKKKKNAGSITVISVKSEIDKLSSNFYLICCIHMERHFSLKLWIK